MCIGYSFAANRHCMYLACRLYFWRASHTRCIRPPSCGRSNNACAETPGLRMVGRILLSRQDKSPGLLRDWDAPSYQSPLYSTVPIFWRHMNWWTSIRIGESNSIVSCILLDKIKLMFWHIYGKVEINLSCTWKWSNSLNQLALVLWPQRRQANCWGEPCTLPFTFAS